MTARADSRAGDGAGGLGRGLGGATAGLAGGGFGGSGAAGGGLGGAGGAVTSISLPLTDLARSEPVVVAVALGQTAALLVLLGARLVVVRRPAVLARRSAPASRAVDTSVPSSRSA